MCPRCDGFGERIYISSRPEYLDLAKQLMQTVREGTFVLVEGNYPLDTMFDPPHDAFIHHEFKCTSCGRAFLLHADTYHGRVMWMPDLRASEYCRK